MSSTSAAAPSSPSASLNTAAAALLLQQQLQTPLSSASVNTVTAQALLKQQEDQLRATRLLLQQRQLDELVATNQAATGSPPASRSNSLLARGSVAGLLGLANSAPNQDALSALAAVRRASVQSVGSTISEAAAKVAAEEDTEEEDSVADEEYFKTYAVTKDGSDQAVKEDEDKACNESFPHKLYRMLYEAEKDGLEAIVSFLPSGRGFTIHKPREFVSEIMPRYFTTRRIASFQRQLNLYGFRRISEGKEKGAYFHKDFMKGKRTRVQRIKRKSTASRPSPTSFAHRFATAPLQFPAVPTSALYGGALLANATPALNNATKELLLARYASAVGAPPAPTAASANLLDITRKGLLANAGATGASHQDILRNAAASLLFKNNNTNNSNPGRF